MAGKISIGIGGWNFPPWRGVFYPAGLAQAKELDYASRHVTSIEINATYYGAQKPESFRRWAATAPEGFLFSVKGTRFATQRKRLAEAAPSVERFFASGVLELGDKLGAFLWQLTPYARFDEGDLGEFLGLLPREAGGRTLRHVIEARHESFAEKPALALLEKHNVALCVIDSGKQPSLRHVTADFVYARLKGAAEEVPTGYTEEELAQWEKTARGWAKGRDVYLYFISGAKVRNPAAAMALIERIKS
jgi:uncharacterized protein YecE (DUF72 family)